MTLRRGRAFPIILTILLIIIIIYLFANIKQPYVVCTKETTNDLGIEINENIQVTLDGNKIQKMDLTKTLIFPEQYLKQEDNYLNSMHYIIENSYDEKYGARPIKRYVSRNIETLIAKAIINEDVKFNSTVTIDIDNDKFIIKGSD